ncbi:MAG: hypothetical protein ACWA41_01620 [Putridiphycobacter sp.]
MKIIFFSIAFMTLLFSCKKNYVCECQTIVNTNGLDEELPIQNFSFSEMKKQQALDSCNAMDYYENLPNQKTTRNCTLK